MVCDAQRPCTALLLLAALSVGPVRGARAEPVLLGASALYESPTLAVPLLFARARDDSDEFRASQVGWTTAVDWAHASSPDVAFVSGVALTPLFAHSSNRIYRAGERDDAAEFHDTSLALSAGFRVRHGVFVQSEWRALLVKEWVDDLPARDAAFWHAPYPGMQLSVACADVRSEEPFRSRVDGMKALLGTQVFAGDTPWGRARLTLAAGRDIADRMFVHANATAFWISTANTVTRELVGGSWDALEGLALYGHPYAELRAQRGTSASVGADARLYESWELGARAALFADEHGAEHGEALVTSVLLAGVLLSLGVATPQADAFHGRLKTLRAFASASAVLLLP